MKTNNLFIVFAMLLLSCESGLNKISFDEATECIISSECTRSHKLHRIGRMYIYAYDNDSSYTSYMIEELEDNGGKGQIYLKEISSAYNIYHWHDRIYMKCNRHEFIRPNCKYKIRNATYGHFPSCVLYLYTDSLNNIYEDAHPYRSEAE